MGHRLHCTVQGRPPAKQQGQYQHHHYSKATPGYAYATALSSRRPSRRRPKRHAQSPIQRQQTFLCGKAIPAALPTSTAPWTWTLPEHQHRPDAIRPAPAKAIARKKPQVRSPKRQTPSSGTDFLFRQHHEAALSVRLVSAQTISQYLDYVWAKTTPLECYRRCYHDHRSLAVGVAS